MILVEFGAIHAAYSSNHVVIAAVSGLFHASLTGIPLVLDKDVLNGWLEDDVRDL